MKLQLHNVIGLFRSAALTIAFWISSGAHASNFEIEGRVLQVFDGTTRMDKPKHVEWFDEPEEHNYPAARSYLSLLYPEADADRLVERLRSAEMVSFRAKDIFRASGLSLLGVSNSHLSKNDDKIQNGLSLSPLLLARSRTRDSVIAADGYHRLCAVYRHNEDAWIPCRII